MIEKTRTEAFSDGVFAIAITLLILEIKVPHPHEMSSNRSLAHELLRLWPSAIAFVTSFATILIIWVNHHGLFSLLHRIDTRCMIVNGVLLLLVTFIPFPTAVLAEHLDGPGARTAAALYCGTFSLVGLGFNLLLYCGTSRPALLRSDLTAADIAKIRRAYYLGTIIYVAATVIAYLHPLTGTIICSLLWIVWMRLDYMPRSNPRSGGP
jgi:uncharacterized membrane protein